MKTFKTWSVHFIFCLSSHSDNSITAFGMFTNLYLVLLLLFAGLLFPKIYFQLIKKETRKWSDIVQSGRWRDSFQALLFYALYSDRARFFNQWKSPLYLNFIINADSIKDLSYILSRVNFYSISISNFVSAVSFCCTSIPIVDDFKRSYMY